jgi:predicted nucleic acid-binding protein
MIAADTSSVIAYLAGADGDDVERIELAMAADELRLPPPAVAELLSRPSPDIERLLRTVPLLDIGRGFWSRAGHTRAVLLARGLKAALADTLIAQCCIDSGSPLVARDRDYHHFVEYCGLKMAI